MYENSIALESIVRQKSLSSLSPGLILVLYLKLRSSLSSFSSSASEEPPSNVSEVAKRVIAYDSFCRYDNAISHNHTLSLSHTLLFSSHSCVIFASKCKKRHSSFRKVDSYPSYARVLALYWEKKWETNKFRNGQMKREKKQFGFSLLVYTG